MVLSVIKYTMFQCLGLSKSRRASKSLQKLLQFWWTGGILHSGGVASRRVCACSLRSRLVSLQSALNKTMSCYMTLLTKKISALINHEPSPVANNLLARTVLLLSLLGWNILHAEYLIIYICIYSYKLQHHDPIQSCILLWRHSALCSVQVLTIWCSTHNIILWCTCCTLHCTEVWCIALLYTTVYCGSVQWCPLQFLQSSVQRNAVRSTVHCFIRLCSVVLESTV